MNMGIKIGLIGLLLVGLIAAPFMMGDMFQVQTETGTEAAITTVTPVNTGSTPSTTPFSNTQYRPFTNLGMSGSGRYSYYVDEPFNDLNSKAWIWRGDCRIEDGNLVMRDGWIQSRSKYTSRTLTINMQIEAPTPRVDPLVFGFTDDFMKQYAAFYVRSGTLWTITGNEKGSEVSSVTAQVPSGYHVYKIAVFTMLGRRTDFYIDGNLFSSHSNVMPTTFMYVFIGSFECTVHIDALKIEPNTSYFRFSPGGIQQATTAVSTYTVTMTSSYSYYTTTTTYSTTNPYTYPYPYTYTYTYSTTTPTTYYPPYTYSATSTTTTSSGRPPYPWQTQRWNTQITTVTTTMTSTTISEGGPEGPAGNSNRTVTLTLTTRAI